VPAAVQQHPEVTAFDAERVRGVVAVHALDIAQLDGSALQLRKRFELAFDVLERAFAIEVVVAILVGCGRIGRVVQRAFTGRAPKVVDKLVLQNADHPATQAGATVVRVQVLGSGGPSLLDEVGCEVIVANGAMILIGPSMTKNRTNTCDRRGICEAENSGLT